jgi:hypothetical protein
MIAGNMRLAGDMIAGFEMVYLFTHFHDLPGKFVAQNVGKARDHRLSPCVPLIDVQV